MNTGPDQPGSGFAPPPGRGGPQQIPRPTTARLGGPPPWAHLAADLRRPSLDIVIESVRQRGERQVLGEPHPDQRESAVLALLYDDPDDGPVVVLTRRARHMRSHAHEVSFPGGRRDPGDDDLWSTALRESCEEIGLDPAAVEPVGEIDAFVTVGSHSLVHPFVGVTAARPELTPSPAEVESIRRVPIHELLLDEVWREELWPIGGLSLRPMPFFELVGDTVWGATGAMLRQLLATVTDTSR